MKKIFLFALSLMLLLGTALGLVACNDRDKTPVAATDIIVGGEAVYSIVYPDGASDKVYSAIDSLIKDIQKVTGVKLDAVKYSMMSKAKKDRFIFVGDTEAEQSVQAKATLAACIDSYAMVVAGDHIAIVGAYDSAVSSALTYWSESLLTSQYNAETKTLRFEDYRFEGTTPIPQTFDSAKLSEYSIVYPTGDVGQKKAATLLRDQIKLITGVNLPLVSSAKAQSPYEILIGNTGRPVSVRAYASGADIMKAHTVVEDGQLQVVSGGAYSAKREVEEILTFFLRNKSWSMEKGTYFSIDLIPETHAITQGSDARIMTLNILADYVVEANNQDALDVELRAEIFAGMLLRYTPDIIGMQECDGAWSTLILEYFDVIRERYGMDYRLLLANYGTMENTITVVYNAARFKCDYSKFHPYEYKVLSDNAKRTVRGAAVAKFTGVTDPSVQILLFSSHWDHTSQEAMNSCATEEAALIKQYEKEFPDAKLFCTGDFNSHKFEGTYLNWFVKEINGAIASNLARENGTLAVDGGYHPSGFIDHIIGHAGAYSVLYHTTILKNSCKLMTDHAPIYADIKLH